MFRNRDYRAAVRRAFGIYPADALQSSGTGCPCVGETAHVHQTFGGAFVEAVIWVPDATVAEMLAPEPLADVMPRIEQGE